MVLLLFGPPGCGKGTQSRYITERLNVPSISTGEMLRAEIQAGTSLGLAAREIMASGGLVSDDLVNVMLATRIADADCRKGFLLDGYPRTVQQAGYLDGALERYGLPPALVLHLDVPMDRLLERMTSRRQCTKCLRIYNLRAQAPKSAGVCDDDAEPLMIRKDDDAAVVHERLRTYEELTRPVLAHYRQGNYHRIRGDRSPDIISEEISTIVKNRGRVEVGQPV